MLERILPLGFQEFCWAVGVSKAILDRIREVDQAMVEQGRGGAGGVPRTFTRWSTALLRSRSAGLATRTL